MASMEPAEAAGQQTDSKPTPPQIQYLFFDCDNTLVATEDVAFEACADLVNQVLQDKGLSARYTSEELIANFVGLTFRRIVGHLQKELEFELDPIELASYVKLEDNHVVAKIAEKAQACTGVGKVLEELQKEGKYTMACVSSSSMRRIQAALAKAGLDKYFAEGHVFSAIDSLPVPTGKPDPAVYNHALKTLGAMPEETMAVEDSRSGVLAATRANIPVLGYVGSYHTKAQKHEISREMVFEGCKYVMLAWNQFEFCLEAVQRRLDQGF